MARAVVAKRRRNRVKALNPAQLQLHEFGPPKAQMQMALHKSGQDHPPPRINHPRASHRQRPDLRRTSHGQYPPAVQRHGLRPWPRPVHRQHSGVGHDHINNSQKHAPSYLLKYPGG
jgi:hypothetical protein